MRSVRMQLPAGSLGRSAWLFPTNQFEAGKASHPPLGSLGPDSLGRETSGQAAGTVAPPPAAPAPSPVKPVEISSDEFEFQPAPTGGKTDTAIYRGHVVVSDPGGTKLSSERLTAKILPGTNQVESVVAERNVDFEIHEPLGERRAHGDKAVYTAANAELELTGADGVEIAFIDPKIEGRGTGTKGVYSGATDTLELVGNSVVTTQFGQVSGDVVALNRANTTLKATGDWRLKLNPAALKKTGPTSVPDL
jgi:lipopolysaccharide export system protein LptA